MIKCRKKKDDKDEYKKCFDDNTIMSQIISVIVSTIFIILFGFVAINFVSIKKTKYNTGLI